jgi:S-adenosylmethionine:tRNA ribosyltransferase-isomerase
METKLFNYDLPPERIAQHPAQRRDLARMMVLHRESGLIEHRKITDIFDYLHAPDLLVLNNTKVVPARIFGKKVATGGKVELLLLEEKEPNIWQVLMKTSRRPKPGDQLLLCSGKVEATMMEEGTQGGALLRIRTTRPLLEILDEEGIPPLPPYISRKGADREQLEKDKERYQTIYASEPGAVAAPTAGLHFTPELLQQLSEKGVEQAELTLHVGLGTFRPVSAEKITDHEMHHERYVVTEKAAQKIKNSREKGGRIVAVGSTSVRTLESLSEIKSAEGSTNIFIYPPYTFRHVDAILTNFHLPQSTLLMMMSAFAGREKMLEAYRIAIEEKYRFFSYGDCMLLL